MAEAVPPWMKEAKERKAEAVLPRIKGKEGKVDNRKEEREHVTKRQMTR